MRANSVMSFHKNIYITVYIFDYLLTHCSGLVITWYIFELCAKHVCAKHGMKFDNLQDRINSPSWLSLRPAIFFTTHWYFPTSLDLTRWITRLPLSVILMRLSLAASRRLPFFLQTNCNTIIFFKLIFHEWNFKSFVH